MNKDTLIDIFLSSDFKSINAFKSKTGIISYNKGHFAIGSISLRNFRLLNKNELTWYSTTLKCFPILDESQKVVKAKLGRERSGMTGEGVITGIIDTGIDPGNDDFKKLVGTNKITRILRIWDQTTEGNPPEYYNYGYEWTENTLGNCNTTDEVGHGTMVTGIATGSGLATGNNQPSGKYVGMSPKSNIIEVKTDGQIEHILDGMNYIWSKAITYNMPCVINLSMGINLGPKNGTSIFESEIDNFVNTLHKLVVVAAGNTQDKKKHANRTTAGITTFNFSQTIYDDYYWIEIFYPDNTDYTISIEPPNQYARLYDVINGIWTNEYLSDQTFSSGQGTGTWNPLQGYICEDGFVGIHNEDYYNNDPYPNTSLKCISIFIDYYTDLYPPIGIKQGDWKIHMSNGMGTFNVYIYNMNDNKIKFTTDIALTGNIIEPGCANNVITVGSMNSKNSWNSLNGWIPPQPGFPLNSISSFSSLGPTFDGRTKPDIYAPGAWIMSTKSSSETNIDYDLIDPDGVHEIGIGTSFATPHVTGAAVLLLQQNPTWLYNDLKQRIIATANLDNGYPLLDINLALCKDNNDCSENPSTMLMTNPLINHQHEFFNSEPEELYNFGETDYKEKPKNVDTKKTNSIENNSGCFKEKKLITPPNPKIKGVNK